MELMDCMFNGKRGWRCRRSNNHAGPCALLPRWWNWSKDARRYRRTRSL